MTIGYAQIFDNLPGGIIVFRADNTYELLYANKEAQNIFDTDSFEELVSLPHRYVTDYLKKLVVLHDNAVKNALNKPGSTEEYRTQRSIETHLQQQKKLKVINRHATFPE